MELKITFTKEELQNQPEIIEMLKNCIHAPEIGNKAQITPAASEPFTSSAVPVNPAPAQPVPVPTAAPQYTLEMIAKAGTVLVDTGKMNELCSLLAKYNVDALTSLDPTQYGAFATELRALGAQI